MSLDETETTLKTLAEERKIEDFDRLRRHPTLSGDSKEEEPILEEDPVFDGRGSLSSTKEYSRREPSSLAVDAFRVPLSTVEDHYPSRPEIRYYRKRMMQQWHKRPMKYKYHAPDGKRLAAGGIFFYEETAEGKGLWLVEEEEVGLQVYTDFGGKYDHNDGDINATISREFREETYNTVEIPYAAIRRVPETKRVYIEGYDHKPVYVCIISHIDDFGIRFDRESIIRERKTIIFTNPQIPDRWYRTLDVKFVLLKDLMSGKAKVSSRLHAIFTALCERKTEYAPEIQKFFESFKVAHKANYL